jgi:hypothetical protein
MPGVLPYALLKTAAAMMMKYATAAYGMGDYREVSSCPAIGLWPCVLIDVSVFYYADKRQPDGRPAGLKKDGVSHAEKCWELATKSKQSKWLVTFVKGEGRR